MSRRASRGFSKLRAAPRAVEKVRDQALAKVFRRRKSPFWRMARGGKYLLFCTAALITIFSPTVIISALYSDFFPLVYVWSGMFFIGSAACLAGTLTRTWVGEYVGLYGVILSLFLYAVGVFADVPNLSMPRIFLGCMFLAFTLSSVARRQDVSHQRRHADYERRILSGKPGV